MKRLLLILLFAWALTGAKAQEYTGVRIQFANGTTQQIDFSEAPRVTFAGKTLKIKLNSTTLEIPRMDILKLSYVKDENKTAVEEIHNDVVKPFVQKGDQLIFYNLPAETPVSIYTAAGSLVTQEKLSGNYTLPLSTLGSGVFILKVAHATYKIVNLNKAL